MTLILFMLRTEEKELQKEFVDEHLLLNPKINSVQ